MPAYRSDCCEALPAGKVDTSTVPACGFCSACRDHCTMYDEDAIPDGDIGPSPVIGVERFGRELAESIRRMEAQVRDFRDRQRAHPAAFSGFAVGIRVADSIAAGECWPQDHREREESRAMELQLLALPNDLISRHEVPCYE